MEEQVRALKLVQHPVAVDRMTTAVATLDDTLRELRTIILGLGHFRVETHPDRLRAGRRRGAAGGDDAAVSCRRRVVRASARRPDPLRR
jgi:hypothetical protein